MFYRSDLLCLARGAELGGRGGICPPCFGDLFSKFWGIFENSFFAIYCRPPIKNLLPPTLNYSVMHSGNFCTDLLRIYSISGFQETYITVD